MRKIDLSALKRNNRGNYVWASGIGKTFHVIWDNIECDFMITNIIRRDRRIYVRYVTNYMHDREIHETRCEHFAQARFNDIFIKTKHKIGDIVNNNMIVEDIFIKADKNNKNRSRLTYKLRCLKCGRTSEPNVDNLDRRPGLCPYCESPNSEVELTKEEIIRNRKQYEKYFFNKEDLYRYSTNSDEITKFVCPDCGKIKEMRISSFYKSEFSCPYCNDNISYPNKFMANLLKNLEIDFIPEFSDDWTEGRRYDFLLTNHNILIEMDGSYHYMTVGDRGSLESSIKIDYFKDNIAIENGFRIIRIDCNYSNLYDRFKYIKSNTIKSGFLELIHKQEKDIDWNYIELNSSKSLLIKACEIRKNNKDMSTVDISKILKVSSCTVKEWLKTGNSLGLCEYDTEEVMKQSGYNLWKKYQPERMIQVINMDTKKIYESVTGCARGLDISRSAVDYICNNGSEKSKYDFNLKYIKNLTLEEFTYYNCEQWLKDNDLWEIFVSKNKVV